MPKYTKRLTSRIIKTLHEIELTDRVESVQDIIKVLENIPRNATMVNSCEFETDAHTFGTKSGVTLFFENIDDIREHGEEN
jgi:phosphatidate phosphatase PAH1